MLYDNQYGFRKAHSTENASTELIDRILQYLQDDDIPFAIFMDLSKGFDTLNHNILLNKLAFYGLDDNSLELMKSYLTNRKEVQLLLMSRRDLS